MEFSKQLNENQRILALTICLEDELLEQLQQEGVLTCSEHENIITNVTKFWSIYKFLKVIQFKSSHCIAKMVQIFKNSDQKFTANLFQRMLISIGKNLNQTFCTSENLTILPADLVESKTNDNMDLNLNTECTLPRNNSIFRKFKQVLCKLWAEYHQHEVFIENMAKTSVSAEYIQTILEEIKKHSRFLEKQDTDMHILFDKCTDLDYKTLKIQQHCAKIDESLIQIELLLVKIPDTDSSLLAQKIDKGLNLLNEVKQLYEQYAEKLNGSKNFRYRIEEETIFSNEIR